MKFVTALLMLAVTAFGLAAQDPFNMPPPPEVKKLDFMLGKWAGKLKYSMGPQTSEGPAEIESKIVAGRYVHGMNKYSMPGMSALEGLHMCTFDPEAKAYKAWWFDQTSSQVMEMTGNFEGGKLAMVSKPITMEGQTMTMRTTYESKSPTELYFKLESKMGEAWMPLIEGTFTKK